MTTVEDIKELTDSILKDDEGIILNVPLKDLVWTIVVFSQEMSQIEDVVFSNYPRYPYDMSEEEVDSLCEDKEHLACRRDELARIIGQYSDFDTDRIWVEVDKLFKNYRSRL